jgi:hypothetical protein
MVSAHTGEQPSQYAVPKPDSQALEQVLAGHLMVIFGGANQIFRGLQQFDHGIDGEVEFKDNNGLASGKKIYVQMKNGPSHLRKRKADGKEIFDVKNQRHLSYWINQPVDVYLVIRGADNIIRWMNVTRYLKLRPKRQRNLQQIVFDGEKLDTQAVLRVREELFGRSLLARRPGSDEAMAKKGRPDGADLMCTARGQAMVSARS